MAFDEANDFLNSTAGAPSLTFDTIGMAVRGRVIDARKVAQTDPQTREVKTFKNGDVRYQLVVTLADCQVRKGDEWVPLRDPSNPDDDGSRRLFARWHSLDAIKEAIGKAGGRLEEGGVLAMKYTGDGEPTGKGLNPPKLFTAAYEAPKASVSVDEL